MKITALDIHQKEFGHGMRGYREDEVDDFLDQIAAEFDAMTREVAALTKRVQDAEAKAIGLDAERNAINSALLIAQRSADELMDKARGEVAQIIADAEAKGSQIVHEALATKRDLLSEIKRLKVEEENFRAGIQRLVSGALQGIDEVRLPSGVVSALDDVERGDREVAEVVATPVAAPTREPAVVDAAAPAAQPVAVQVAQTPVAAPVAAAVVEAVQVAPTPAAEPQPKAEAVASDELKVEVVGSTTAPQPPVSQGLIMGEVGAAPALNVELEEPAEFQFGGASVWGESDDDIEIEEID